MRVRLTPGMDAAPYRVPARREMMNRAMPFRDAPFAVTMPAGTGSGPGTGDMNWTVPVRDAHRTLSREATMKRIYLVEYSTLARNRLREAVARLCDCQIVGEAEIASDAVSGVEELDPDVVITDLMLKFGTGVDVVKRIRARHGPARPVIYVLTNRANPAHRATLRAAGANGLFDKAREYGLLMEELRHVA